MKFAIGILTVLIIGLTDSFTLSESTSVSHVDSKENIDTLRVGYTYWWPQSSPFINPCGGGHSLVLYGEIADMQEPIFDEDRLYTPQTGVIKIIDVLYLSEGKQQHYNAEEMMVTDCFYEAGLDTGQQVMVFCYEYEDYFSIPGKECIVPISGPTDNVLLSMLKYYTAEKDVKEILESSEHWEEKGYSLEMKMLGACLPKND